MSVGGGGFAINLSGDFDTLRFARMLPTASGTGAAFRARTSQMIGTEVSQQPNTALTE